MFTGLVEEMAAVVAVDNKAAGTDLVLQSELLQSDAAIGDSICINGCCLTVVSIEGSQLTFQAGEETLSRTNLGKLQPGDKVNVERSLAVGQRMGGHYVSGHIDSTAVVVERDEDGEWANFWFEVPPELTRQMASKGSVAIDGISLTLVEVTENRFSVALIPHTLDVTTLGKRHPGDIVNIETDLLAKYVQQQLQRN